MSMEVSETNSLITNVPEDEVWRIEDFKNYSIKLINNGGQAEIVDFSKYRKVNKKQ